jgi:hypothetical protein
MDDADAGATGCRGLASAMVSSVPKAYRHAETHKIHVNGHSTWAVQRQAAGARGTVGGRPNLLKGSPRGRKVGVAREPFVRGAFWDIDTKLGPTDELRRTHPLNEATLQPACKHHTRDAHGSGCCAGAPCTRPQRGACCCRGVLVQTLHARTLIVAPRGTGVGWGWFPSPLSHVVPAAPLGLAGPVGRLARGEGCGGAGARGRVPSNSAVEKVGGGDCR